MQYNGLAANLFPKSDRETDVANSDVPHLPEAQVRLRPAWTRAAEGGGLKVVEFADLRFLERRGVWER